MPTRGRRLSLFADTPYLETDDDGSFYVTAVSLALDEWRAVGGAERHRSLLMERVDELAATEVLRQGLVPEDFDVVDSDWQSTIACGVMGSARCFAWYRRPLAPKLGGA